MALIRVQILCQDEARRRRPPLRNRECAGFCVLPMTKQRRIVLIKAQILCQDEARRRRPPP